MRGTILDGLLTPEALREIERSVHGKLRALRLSEDFIARNVEDAVQKGLVELLRKRDGGTEVRDAGGFVVEAAYRRAIDELRREARAARGAEVEDLIASGAGASPPAEEEGLESLAAAELHGAIEELSGEDRQALTLHYFDELSDRRSAELLYCSERTYRRRLAKALAHLSTKLGVPVPDPGSKLGLEVGVSAWVSLRGARVVLHAGPLDAVLRLAEGAFEWGAHRVRDFAAAFESSGTSERVSALAASPAGRLAGVCAAAACLVGGATVVSVTRDSGDSSRAVRAQSEWHKPRTRLPDVKPLAVHPVREPADTQIAAPPHVEPRHRSAAEDGEATVAHRRSTLAHKSERVEAAEHQAQGVARAGETEEAAATPTEPISEPAETEPAPPAGSPESSSSSSTESNQVDNQFRGPLG